MQQIPIPQMVPKRQGGRPGETWILKRDVRELREHLEQSQATFAKAAGISVDTLQRAERGEYGGTATDRTLRKICKHLGNHGIKITPSELKVKIS